MGGFLCRYYLCCFSKMKPRAKSLTTKKGEEQLKGYLQTVFLTFNYRVKSVYIVEQQTTVLGGDV